MNEKAPSLLPIFILGNPRSGTTLLRLMLTCHPDIVVPPEGGFLVHLHDKYADYAGDLNVLHQFSLDVIACRKMDEWGMDAERLALFLKSKSPTNYSELASGVYEFYASTQKAEALRWGDKNNYYIKHVKTLHSLYPNAKFVHIVRDGRDVACSYRDLSQTKGKYAPQLPNSIIESAKQWSDNVREIAASLVDLGEGSWFQIKYEELVSHPEQTLVGLCKFLGEEFSPEMLNYHQTNANRKLEPDTYLPWKKKTQEAVDESRAGRWKTDMFLEDILLFERIAGEQLSQYGYSLSGLEAGLPPEILSLLHR